MEKAAEGVCCGAFERIKGWAAGGSYLRLTGCCWLAAARYGRSSAGSRLSAYCWSDADHTALIHLVSVAGGVDCPMVQCKYADDATGSSIKTDAAPFVWYLLVLVASCGMMPPKASQVGLT